MASEAVSQFALLNQPQARVFKRLKIPWMIPMLGSLNLSKPEYP
jgi:hypothetical protein